jgi:ribosome-associated heat shock protein Hsp15
MDPTSAVRADRWLWSVRLYKTRSLAAGACNAGKIQINGQPCKPARDVRAGDILTASLAGITRTVKVLAVLESRVGAKLVSRYLEDRTPAEEYEKLRQRKETVPDRPKGTGRPTKRDRRILQSFFGEDA